MRIMKLNLANLYICRTHRVPTLLWRDGDAETRFWILQRSNTDNDNEDNDDNEGNDNEDNYNELNDNDTMKTMRTIWLSTGTWSTRPPLPFTWSISGSDMPSAFGLVHICFGTGVSEITIFKCELFTCVGQKKNIIPVNWIQFNWFYLYHICTRSGQLTADWSHISDKRFPLKSLHFFWENIDLQKSMNQQVGKHIMMGSHLS